MRSPVPCRAQRRGADAARAARRRGFSDVEVAHFTRLRNEALASEHFAEGRRAFGEKRAPKFGG